MKFITLTQGQVATVDDEDYPQLSAYKWHAHETSHGFYAHHSVRLETGEYRTIAMHRMVMGLEFGDNRQVDHINHNGLDNRRSNLRVCTLEQNIRNQRKKRRKATSSFKGVSLHKPGRWRAVIRANGRQVHLGLFNSEHDAAAAYNAAAVRYFGEFANPNKIEAMAHA
jgi:hypothetical protein